MDSHQEFPKICKFCSMKFSHESNHIQKCDEWPVSCYNLCGATNIKKCDLEDHLKFHCQARINPEKYDRLLEHVNKVEKDVQDVKSDYIKLLHAFTDVFIKLNTSSEATTLTNSETTTSTISEATTVPTCKLSPSAPIFTPSSILISEFSYASTWDYSLPTSSTSTLRSTSYSDFSDSNEQVTTSNQEFSDESTSRNNSDGGSDQEDTRHTENERMINLINQQQEENCRYNNDDLLSENDNNLGLSENITTLENVAMVMQEIPTILIEDNTEHLTQDNLNIVNVQIIPQQNVMNQPDQNSTSDINNKTFSKVLEEAAKNIPKELNSQLLQIPKNLKRPSLVKWRISNFTSNRFYDSPAFYTTLGYRIQVAVRLTNFLEIHCRLVPGKFDEKLIWPCRAELTFIVIDQAYDEKAHHISRVAKSNHHERCYRRPESKKSETGWYISHFASKEKLHEKNYVKNQNLKLHIEVRIP